jgi:NAD(P)-dependent dehydrogenase (short-subunit alcohol dehydrogenase family)
MSGAAADSRLRSRPPVVVEGRIALVTGGASGFGFASAAALAERGARVVLLDRDEAAGVRARGPRPREPPNPLHDDPPGNDRHAAALLVT